MAFDLYNRVKQTCTGNGTGNLNILAGSAAVGHRKISSVYSEGDTGWFVLESGDDWEIIEGTVSSSDSITIDELVRTTVIESTNGGAKINLDPLETHTLQVITPEQFIIYLSGTPSTIVRQNSRNAIMESISIDLTANRPSSPLDNQVHIKLGDTTIGDGGQEIEYWDGATWQSLGYSSANISYDNTTSGLSATNVKTAIDELESAISSTVSGVSSVFGRSGGVVAANGDYTASQITYSNATSGLVAINCQAAIDEMEARIDTAEGKITAVEGVVGAQESAIISITDSTGVTHDDTIEDASLTDSSGGVADGTVSAVGDTSAADESATINDNFAEVLSSIQKLENNDSDLSAKIEEILVALRNHGLIAT